MSTGGVDFDFRDVTCGYLLKTASSANNSSSVVTARAPCKFPLDSVVRRLLTLGGTGRPERRIPLESVLGLSLRKIFFLSSHLSLSLSNFRRTQHVARRVLYPSLRVSHLIHSLQCRLFCISFSVTIKHKTLIS